MNNSLQDKLTYLAFSLTLFMSATLMFAIQPMAGKMLLPLIGGTPAGWTVAAPNTVRLSESGKQVLLCGPQQGTMLKVW